MVNCNRIRKQYGLALMDGDARGAYARQGLGRERCMGSAPVLSDAGFVFGALAFRASPLRGPLATVCAPARTSNAIEDVAVRVARELGWLRSANRRAGCLTASTASSARSGPLSGSRLAGRRVAAMRECQQAVRGHRPALHIRWPPRPRNPVVRVNAGGDRHRRWSLAVQTICAVVVFDHGIEQAHRTGTVDVLGDPVVIVERRSTHGLTAWRSPSTLRLLSDWYSMHAGRAAHRYPCRVRQLLPARSAGAGCAPRASPRRNASSAG